MESKKGFFRGSTSSWVCGVPSCFMLFWGCFQHTELEHTPKRNLYQQAIFKGFRDSFRGRCRGDCRTGVRYPGVLKMFLELYLLDPVSLELSGGNSCFCCSCSSLFPGVSWFPIWRAHILFKWVGEKPPDLVEFSGCVFLFLWGLIDHRLHVYQETNFWTCDICLLYMVSGLPGILKVVNGVITLISSPEDHWTLKGLAILRTLTLRVSGPFTLPLEGPPDP